MKPEESSEAEESSSDEESSEVEESSSDEESSEVEESSSSEESSDEESSSDKESSEVESSSDKESSDAEESSSGEESSGDVEHSPYTDKERADLQSIGGKISAIQTKTYDGSAYKPTIRVTVTEDGRKRTLTEGTDYSVSYQQYTDAGQGTVIVRGNGLYKGTLKTTFEIKPKTVRTLKIIAGSVTTGSQSELPKSQTHLWRYKAERRRTLHHRIRSIQRQGRQQKN